MKLKTLEDMGMVGMCWPDVKAIDKKDLRKEAIKWIKELEKVDTAVGYDYRTIEKHVAKFKEKFGIDIIFDEEYNWTDDMIEFLTSWIKRFFNITEDLK